MSWILLAGVVLASFVMRALDLDHIPGINGDEPQYGVVARQLLRGEPVAMRTGTGLLMNPIFISAQTIAHRLAPASLVTLRSIPAVLSLLSVVLAFALFRQRGLTFAALFACALSVLPIHLGYARIAWDPSAIPLMMVLALAAALRLRPLLTAALFALSLWVHPSTVLSAPILLAPFIAANWPRTPEGALRAPKATALALALLLLFAGLALIAALVALQALPTVVLWQLRPERLEAIVERLASPSEALRFGLGYLELISGPTLYRYVPGSMPEGSARLHVVGLLAVMGVCVFGARRLIRERSADDIALGVALLLSLAGTFLLAGPIVLQPSTGRYGLFLTVPGCLVIASCLTAAARSQTWLRIGCAVVGALLLGSFSIHYLQALHHPDPARENTFRTGELDPKQRALQEVVRMRAPGQTAVVLAEDWWIYWTLRYLAENETNVRVTIVNTPWDVRFPRDFEPPPFDARTVQVFAVAWARGLFDAALAKRSLEHADVGGYEPQPILRVYRMPMPGQAVR